MSAPPSTLPMLASTLQSSSAFFFSSPSSWCSGLTRSSSSVSFSGRTGFELGSGFGLSAMTPIPSGQFALQSTAVLQPPQELRLFIAQLAEEFPHLLPQGFGVTLRHSLIGFTSLKRFGDQV